MLKKVWTSIALLVCPMMAFAAVDKATKQRMIADLDFIKSTFEVAYAPAEWKKSHWGWDLDAEVAKAKEKVLNTDSWTIKDYQKEVARVLATTRDYHVGVLFRSTESAKLPFGIKSAEGKYYVIYTDECKLCPGQFNIDVGSEIVDFDGRPIHEAVEELKKQIAWRGARPATDQSIAEMYFTIRSGMMGYPVPRGPVTITVKPPYSETLKSYQLVWDYTPERVVSDARYQFENDVSTPLSTREQALQLINKPWIFPAYGGMSSDSKLVDIENPFALSHREGFLPPLGKIIWQTRDDNPFHAYLFMTPDKEFVGYIRISDYIGDVEEIEAFGAIIDRFEEMADALIIDQLNNPGGLVFYSYALASMLSDKPLATPKHRIALTQAEVQIAAVVVDVLQQVRDDVEAREVLGESLNGYPVNYQVALSLLEYFRTLIDEWTAKQYLTKPTFLFGIDQINPNQAARFTKPIMVLVNEMDLSCGDFFPAILQDNNRAVIFGTRTAGAGGFLQIMHYPNRLGIMGISYTGSIAERTNKQPIEDIGVLPDVEYELKAEDLQQNFSGYVEALHDVLDQLLKHGSIKAKDESPEVQASPEVKTETAAALPEVDNEELTVEVEEA